MIILAISALLQNEIQIVLDFNGGIFGTFILFFLPALEVMKARKVVRREGDPINYIKWLPLFILLLGVGFMGFNLYHVLTKYFIK